MVGPYIGLGVIQADGEQDTPLPDFPLDGSPVSLFGGYNCQSGNVVYGGGLAVFNNDIQLIAFPLITYNRLIDMKGRVGYAAGAP